MQKNKTWIRVASCAMVMTTTGILRAATASADMQNLVGPFPLGNTGTISLYATSIQNANSVIPAVGPNDTVTVTLNSGGVAVEPPPNAEDSTTRISVPFKSSPALSGSYGPSVTLLKQDKSLIKQQGDLEKILSKSSGYSAYATDYYRMPAAGRTTVPTFGSSATGRIQDPNSNVREATGKAAAMAVDPFIVTGGSSYAYAPVIDASLEADTYDDNAGILIYAYDSNTFTSSSDLDDFAAAGQPLDQALWSLSVSASGQLLSPSQLNIDFELNPNALKEIYFPGEPSLSPADEALLIDAQIDAALAGSGGFTVSDNIATLTDFQLFPDDTTYTPYNGADVQFAEGVNSAVDEVPEPFAGALLFGLICMVIAPTRIRPKLLQRA